MGALHFVLRYLLQTISSNGEKALMSDLIYAATFVFALMCLGLIFTGIEFKKMQDEESQAEEE
jgi:hypothetical protein